MLRRSIIDRQSDDFLLGRDLPEHIWPTVLEVSDENRRWFVNEAEGCEESQDDEDDDDHGCDS